MAVTYAKEKPFVISELFLCIIISFAKRLWKSGVIGLFGDPSVQKKNIPI